MDLYDVLDQVVELLRHRGRATYRALKYQFTLDDEGLEALKEELIDAQRTAVDEDGKVLMWASPVPSAKFQVPSQDSKLRTSKPELSPVSYTPVHLAERIRAEQVALEVRSGTDGDARRLPLSLPISKGPPH